MHLTLISAKKMTPQPHWSVWYPKPDFASWSSVENPLIWSTVSQSISFELIVSPCDLGCQWVYWPGFQHVYASSPLRWKYVGSSSSVSRHPCSLHTVISICIWLNIRSLKLVNGGLAPASGGAHRETESALVETGHVTCRLYCTPTACILYSQTWIPIKPSAKATW